MKKILLRILFFLSLSFLCSFEAEAQKIYELERSDADLLFFNKNTKQYIPHIIRMYERGSLLHKQIWDVDTLRFHYKPEKPLILFTDWEDDGNAGVAAIPRNMIQIGISPMNFSFFVAPSVERFQHLFNHEYTHVIMTDKYNRRSYRWRKFIGGKVAVNSEYPLSAVWSYMTVPRWYCPRWYHEGIACFMETWLAGGCGRALGGYDEMYFRTLVESKTKIYSVVGLETEGSTSDFQVGTNSYLYGTRFISYLALRNGTDTLTAFYNCTADSKLFYGKQFKKTYGENIHKVWKEWIEYEKQHQKENVNLIETYPVTQTVPLADKPLGSVCPPILDRKRGLLYMAVNHPGDFAQVISLNLTTGKQKRLMYVDGPMLYQTAYLAFDSKHDRLFVTSNNGGYRGLKVYDLNKRRIVKTKRFTRMSEIKYDTVRDRLYGVVTSAGISSVVYYDYAVEKKDILYSLPFGKSIADLDISHDGNYMTFTVFGLQGEQTIVKFNIVQLENADFTYEKLLELEDANLGQFRFSLDDSRLYGSSYYTGVSNIWSLNIKSGEFDLLSNAVTGLFAPIQTDDSTLIALRFERDGMLPVRMKINKLEDANAIAYLGQKVFERNPSLEKLPDLQDSSLLNIAYKEVYDSIKRYSSFKSLRFAGAYPDISGFTDGKAFNNVTPVIGYSILFQDKTNIHKLILYFGTSPWSRNEWKNKFHAKLQWHFWSWSLVAGYNAPCFYDLSGPLQQSRKGYSVGISYDKTFTTRNPYNYYVGGNISTYGMMDKLPMFQNIDVDEGITSLQTASVYFNVSKTRRSLGGVMNEQGYLFGVKAYTYLADRHFYPSAVVKFDGGFLLPFIRNTSFWIRTAAGQSFGNIHSAFGNDYFGGFRNNYIDNQDAYRYRDVNAFPGVDIDKIKAHSFVKVMAELNLKPFHFNNFGFLGLYPTYAQLSFFSTDIASNLWGKGVYDNYINVGAQLNFEVVLFSYMKTMWSFGYAHAFHTGTGKSHGEVLLSLKLF